MAVSGYQHRLYAASLGDIGSPVPLTECGGWVLRRSLARAGIADAAGPYPLFSCPRWDGLQADLQGLRDSDLLTLTIVPDPFGIFTEEDLRRNFDVVRAYKAHYVRDMRLDASATTAHHRGNVRRARRLVEVDLVAQPLDFADEWVVFYRQLVAQRRIVGPAAMSGEALRTQLRVPGIRMFRASIDGSAVGYDLWYVQGDVAHAHLAAFSALGYRTRASYASKAAAIDHFSEEVRWMNFGGVPDASKDGSGLDAFKRGWASGSRVTYLCGKVFDEGRYAGVTQGPPGPGAFFPAYRSQARPSTR